MLIQFSGVHLFGCRNTFVDGTTTEASHSWNTTFQNAAEIAMVKFIPFLINQALRRGGLDVEIRDFLTSAQVWSYNPASRSVRLLPRQRPPIAHWVGFWIGSRARLYERRRDVSPNGTPTPKS
jgi:hypothetical protein